VVGFMEATVGVGLGGGGGVLPLPPHPGRNPAVNTHSSKATARCIRKARSKEVRTRVPVDIRWPVSIGDLVRRDGKAPRLITADDQSAAIRHGYSSVIAPGIGWGWDLASQPCGTQRCINFVTLCT
jgi:hypothetical protein